VTQSLVPTPPVPPSPPADANPFRYGWRYVRRIAADGREVLDEIPLTLEDVLHPQEDDVIPERPIHQEDRTYLSDTLRTRLPRLAGRHLLADCLVDCGVPGQQNTSPDISLFADVARLPPPERGTFRLVESGGRPVLVIELVSPDTRTNDVDRRPEEYYRAGVPLYVIVDQQREAGPRTLRPYRHTPSGYEPIPLDEQKTILLEPLQLRLGLRDNRVVCYDSVTGDALGDYSQEHEARLVAEAQQRLEMKARLAAEAGQRQELEARLTAERDARAKAEALAAAEQRLRELEAELRRQRGERSPKPSDHD
jgi:Uma2 family endonuclease